MRDVRPAGWVTYCSICASHNAESPKQGRKRFNSIAKTINFSYPPIIYLCLTGSKWVFDKVRELKTKIRLTKKNTERKDA